MTTLDFGTGPDFDESPVSRIVKRRDRRVSAQAVAVYAIILLCAAVGLSLMTA